LNQQSLEDAWDQQQQQEAEEEAEAEATAVGIGVGGKTLITATAEVTTEP